MSTLGVDIAAGAARRRRERRLRSMLRHERMTVAMALAEALHHTAPRGQKTARAGEEESELHYTDKDRETPPPQPVLFSLYEEEPGGRRLASLAEPPGPQERAQRHTTEQLADVAPMVPSLAVPEPQMVDQLVAMVKHVDSVVPEQIIAVPKISWPSRFPRTVLCEPQKAEQLVEVPVLLQRLGPLGGDLQAHGSYVAWWLRMAPDPFEGNHRQPRAVYKYWAPRRWLTLCGVVGLLLAHAAQVPAVQGVPVH